MKTVKTSTFNGTTLPLFIEPDGTCSSLSDLYQHCFPKLGKFIFIDKGHYRYLRALRGGKDGQLRVGAPSEAELLRRKKIAAEEGSRSP